jgi:hypothetical protein
MRYWNDDRCPVADLACTDVGTVPAAVNETVVPRGLKASAAAGMIKSFDYKIITDPSSWSKTKLSSCNNTP